MKNGNHLFQHAAFPPPSEVILNQRSKSQLMPVCFGYSKPNLCSMRAEALHGTRGWESAVSPGELAEVDNVSFIAIAKSEGNAVVNYALATRAVRRMR